MNKARWRSRSELGILSDAEWMAKLTEEVGEVAREVASLTEATLPGRIQRHKRHLVRELEHVEFIAAMMRGKVERDMSEKALNDALDEEEAEFEGVSVDG